MDTTANRMPAIAYRVKGHVLQTGHWRKAALRAVPLSAVATTGLLYAVPGVGAWHSPEWYLSTLLTFVGGWGLFAYLLSAWLTYREEATVLTQDVLVQMHRRLRGVQGEPLAVELPAVLDPETGERFGPCVVMVHKADMDCARATVHPVH